MSDPFFNPDREEIIRKLNERWEAEARKRREEEAAKYEEYLKRFMRRKKT